VVTEGASISNAEAIALAVLQQAMGTSPFIKYSNNSATSRVGKAAAQATDNPVAVCATFSWSALLSFLFTGIVHHVQLLRLRSFRIPSLVLG
jgi:hypothetical protein